MDIYLWNCGKTCSKVHKWSRKKKAPRYIYAMRPGWKKKVLAGELKVSHGVHIFYQFYIISLFYEPDIENKSNIKIKKHPKAWQWLSLEVMIHLQWWLCSWHKKLLPLLEFPGRIVWLQNISSVISGTSSNHLSTSAAYNNCDTEIISHLVIY